MDTTSKVLLAIIILVCGVTGYYSYQTSLEVKEMKEQMQVAQLKIDSLMLATAKIEKSAKAVSANKRPKSFWEVLASEYEANEKANAAKRKAEAAKEKVKVSATYRLEDRYVIGQVKLPDYLGSQSGLVMVNIIVNQFGTVTKTSVAEGATITDPEVIESARRAALKTDFNSNYDASKLAEGTITYTFKKK